MVSSKVIEIDSGKPGPSVAIFAGIHGNEKAGVYALQELLPGLELKRGKLYAAFGNPAALAADVRMLGKNLNRCFYAGNAGTDPEDVRARELMAVLDKCDALLDLHMFYDDNGQPFAICEDNGVALASKFDVDIISTNWAETEPGATDGYMHLQGKIGICVECGPLAKSREYTGFAKHTALQFLKHLDMISDTIAFSDTAKCVVETYQTICKSGEDFVLSAGLSNFQLLWPGQLIAKDERQEYRAQAGDCIIFPHYKARVGEEAYILGRVK